MPRTWEGILISSLWLTYRAVWSPARWKCSEEIWVEKWWEPEVILVHLSSSYMRSVWNLFPERVINLHSITHYLCFLLSLVCCLFACIFCYLKLLYYLIAFFISLSLFFVLALLCDGVFRNNSFHSISLFMFFIICLHQLLRQASYHFCVKQEGKKRKSLRVFLFCFVFVSFFFFLFVCFLSRQNLLAFASLFFGSIGGFGWCLHFRSIVSDSSVVGDVCRDLSIKNWRTEGYWGHRSSLLLGLKQRSAWLQCGERSHTNQLSTSISSSIRNAKKHKRDYLPVYQWMFPASVRTRLHFSLIFAALFFANLFLLFLNTPFFFCLVSLLCFDKNNLRAINCIDLSLPLSPPLFAT